MLVIKFRVFFWVVFLDAEESLLECWVVIIGWLCSSGREVQKVRMLGLLFFSYNIALYMASFCTYFIASSHQLLY